MTLILRDHDEEKLAGHEALVRRLADEAVAGLAGLARRGRPCGASTGT